MNCIEKLIDWVFDNVDPISELSTDTYIIGKYNGYTFEADTEVGNVIINEANFGYIGKCRLAYLLAKIPTKSIEVMINQQKRVADLILAYNYKIPEADIVELIEYYIGGLKQEGQLIRPIDGFGFEFWGSFVTDQDFAREFLQAFVNGRTLPDWLEVDLSKTYNSIFKSMIKYTTESGLVYYFFKNGVKL